MNDFLRTLALRSLRPNAAIQPRLPSLFEPPASGERLPTGGLHAATVQPLAGQPDGNTSFGQVAEHREMRRPDGGTPPAERASSPAPPAIQPEEMLGSVPPPAASRSATPSGMPSHSTALEREEGKGSVSVAGNRPRGAPVLPPVAEEGRASRPPQAPHMKQQLAQDAAMDPNRGRQRLVPRVARLAPSPAGNALPRERRGQPGRVGEPPETRPSLEPEPGAPPPPRVLVPQVELLAVAKPEGTAPSMGPSRREARFAPGFQDVATQEEAPVVQVTIGRIEVRARQVAPAPPSGVRSEPRLPLMSLDEHLRQRNGGGR